MTKSKLSKMILLSEDQYRSLLENKNINAPETSTVVTPPQPIDNVVIEDPVVQYSEQPEVENMGKPPPTNSLDHQQVDTPKAKVENSPPGVSDARQTRSITAQLQQLKSENEHDNDQMSINEITELVPKNIKHKSEQLLKHLNQSKVLKWDKQGRIVIDEKTLESSNIADLVRFVTQSNRKSTFIPSNLIPFLCSLKKSHVPLLLLNAPTRERLNAITDPDDELKQSIKLNENQSQTGSGVVNTNLLPPPGLSKFPSPNQTKKNITKNNIFTWTNY